MWKALACCYSVEVSESSTVVSIGFTFFFAGDEVRFLSTAGLSVGEEVAVDVRESSTSFSDSCCSVFSGAVTVEPDENGNQP